MREKKAWIDVDSVSRSKSLPHLRPSHPYTLLTRDLKVLKQDAKVFQPSVCLFIICSSTNCVFQSLPGGLECLDGLDEVAG